MAVKGKSLNRAGADNGENGRIHWSFSTAWGPEGYAPGAPLAQSDGGRSEISEMTDW